MQRLCLKKGEDRRIRFGHPWIYSNEINTTLTPLKHFQPGELVIVEADGNKPVGIAYLNPHSLIAARMLSQDIHEQINTAFFKSRLQTALRLREQLFSKPYYRLVFGEADALPGLIVDRFHHDIVMQLNTAGMENQQTAIVEAMMEVLPDSRTIFLRNDSPIRQMEGLPLYTKVIYGELINQGHVEENGVSFTFPFAEGQKTGWFYDHRMNRSRLASYTPHRTVLDIFSYLGAFGVQAAVFGAKQVDCIEVSAQACELISKNAEANSVADRVTTLCIDAFDGMKSLLQSGKQYDVITLDPPAFVKKAKDHREGINAYQRINELALRLLTPNGILFSCSCSMHVTEDELLQAIRRAAYNTQTSVQLVERGHQGPDHPIHPAIHEMNYLKCLIMRKL